MKYKKVVVEILEINKELECSFNLQVGEKIIFNEKGVDKKVNQCTIKSLLIPVKAILSGQKMPAYHEGEDFYWAHTCQGKDKKLCRIVFRLTPVKK